jgi:hypothetical protein
MENQEVADFVNKHRHDSNHDLSKSSTACVTVENSHIARLLSEEARVRWMTVVENEGVIVDDITALVIEFSGIHDKFPTVLSETIQASDDIREYDSPRIIRKRDPLRASIIMGKVTPA